ncbi:MAG: hypothetical protein NTV11_09940 [Rhodocyclales bacterium]|nr:hypothetical protein [Rhodocyclales bacterium]
MAIYLVTGKLRSGKTLACVGRIRDALLDGKRVATNLDLNLEAMLPHRTPLRGEGKDRRNLFDLVRIPDKPTVADLEAIGPGFEGEYDENKNGLLVLDELGAWLNTRTFQDKQRMPVIDWMLHSGKKGWDVYFIIQHQNMIDKQVREGLAEFLVTCKRLDRMRIPLLGRLFSLFGLKLMMPKVHIASVRYGLDAQAMVSDTWIYRAKDMYRAYDTRQVFKDERGTETYQVGQGVGGVASGAFSYLSPWHTAGRHAGPSLNLVEQWREFKRLAIEGPPRPKLSIKPKHPVVAAVMKMRPEDRMLAVRKLEALGVFG